jgi:glycosyltransferase involved in cell wall biosynthesis
MRPPGSFDPREWSDAASSDPEGIGSIGSVGEGQPEERVPTRRAAVVLHPSALRRGAERHTSPGPMSEAMDHPGRPTEVPREPSDPVPLRTPGALPRPIPDGARRRPTLAVRAPQPLPPSELPLRVLHVVQGYAPAIGGTERVIQRLSEELVRQFGDDVTVFTTDSYSAEAFPRPALPRMRAGWEVSSGVRVRRFPVWRAPGALLNIPQKLAFRWNLPLNERLRTWYGGPLIPGLANAIRDWPADVIVASSFPLMHMYDALRGARRSGRPCVFIGGLHPEDRWGFDRTQIHAAIREVDRYIAYTSYEAERVTHRGADPQRIDTIGLGVDPEPFLATDTRKAKERLGLGAGKVVGFIGQLGVHKGVDTVLEAMPAVWREFPDASLLIAGARTVYAAQVEAKIAAYPQEFRSRVKLVEDFGEADKPFLFGALDVFALPSAFESFGLTYLEAWAAAKPVVGSLTGAVSCVIDHGRDGLLVPYRSPAALSRSILRLLNDSGEARAMGEAGRRKVVERHAWPVVARRFRDAYVRARGL